MSTKINFTRSFWLLPGIVLTPRLSCRAQDYPVKPIRIVVPTPPGGGNDIMARLTAQKLNDAWGQPVIVDNRPGAGGAIAMELVAHSLSDGYTLLLGSTNLVVLPSLTRTAFDPIGDFAPIALLATAPNLLLVHPSLPASSVPELIALAKARPGQINYASGSSGSSAHLAGELFKRMAGVAVTHIPYKGAGPALNDLIGGQVQMMFSNPAVALPHVRSGRVRALATTGARRLAERPDLPTVAESGLPGYEASTWWGVLAPRATPVAIVRKLNAQIAKIVTAVDISERIAALGAMPAGGPPEQLAAHLKAEMAKWPRLIRDAGVRLE